MQAPHRSILFRCLSGEASPEEAALLDAWINASPGNRQEFESLWQLWQKTTERTSYDPPDIKKDWQDLHARIQPAPAPVSIQPPVRPLIWKALSVLLAGSVIIGLIIFKTNRPPASPPVYPGIVRRSGQGALKDTLSNGTILTLDEKSVFAYPSPDHDSRDTATLINGKVYLQAGARPLTIGLGELSV